MTLISLLIVLGLQAFIQKPQAWHVSSICLKYFKLLEALTSSNLKHTRWVSTIWGYLVQAFVPSLLIFAVLSSVDSIILAFLIQTFILWSCLGCPAIQARYKLYKAAVKREDFEACSLHSIAFGNETGELNKIGEQLVFINFRHYAAVIIWFVILGVPGLVFYSVLKAMYAKHHIDNKSDAKTDINLSIDGLSEEANETNEHEGVKTLDSIMHCIDWLPVRITALGFAMVGHFTRATRVWVNYLLDFNINNKEFLSYVSLAAEDIDAQSDNPLATAQSLLKLAKRNVGFLIVFIAILTMVGAVA